MDNSAVKMTNNEYITYFIKNNSKKQRGNLTKK